MKYLGRKFDGSWGAKRGPQAERAQMAEVPKTAFWKAAETLLERLAEALGGSAKDVTITLVGGAAVHYYTHKRISDDIEGIFSHKVILPSDLVVSYPGEDGKEHLLIYDSNFSRDTGLIHPDYERDAVVVRTTHDRLRINVLSPTDLAVTKVGRFGGQDREDIAGLAERGLLDSSAFEARAKEALTYYVGQTQWIEQNIADAVQLIKQHEPQNENDCSPR